MKYRVTIGDRLLEVEVRGSEVLVDGEQVEVDFEGLDGVPVHSLILNGVSHRVVARAEGSGAWRVELDGEPFSADVVDERTAAIREMTGGAAAARGPRPVVAPMPGLVVRVEVSEGDRVEEGQGIVIVEAMKMENELRASGPGVVERIHVAEGDAVEKDQLLVALSAVEEEEGAS